MIGVWEWSLLRVFLEVCCQFMSRLARDVHKKLRPKEDSGANKSCPCVQQCILENGTAELIFFGTFLG